MITNVRTYARSKGINLAKLINILSHRRPADSKTEQEFVSAFLSKLPGIEVDDYGNHYLRIGTAPVLWSCHTDTVSDDDGLQNIKWDGNILSLNQPRRGQTLGADDGAGLWLMLEMIKAGREGLYVFHRDEECGGLGSQWIAKNTPELLKDIKIAIAFDRKATHSVITRQRFSRCCSDNFGKALAAALNETEGLNYALDDGGVFTDTANYTDLIPECTNLSVGYYNEHTEKETLDVEHLLWLREALLTLDTTALPIERQPGDDDDLGWGGYGGYYGGYSQGWSSNRYRLPPPKSDYDRLVDIVKNRPLSVALLLEELGLTPDEVAKEIDLLWERQKSAEKMIDYQDNDPADDVTDMDLWCNDCSCFVQQDTRFYEDACGDCGSLNVEWLETRSLVDA